MSLMILGHGYSTEELKQSDVKISLGLLLAPKGLVSSLSGKYSFKGKCLNSAYWNMTDLHPKFICIIHLEDLLFQ